MMTQTLPDILGQTNVVPARVRDGNDGVDIVHGLDLKEAVKRVKSISYTIEKSYVILSLVGLYLGGER